MRIRFTSSIPAPEQCWDEMFLPFIAYTVDREDPSAAPKIPRQ